MKIRNGFVSNSSTSSFTCDVCGETIAERDLCLSDAGMYKCINNHTICESHLKEIPEPTSDDDDYDYRYELPASICPCCTFDCPTEHDMLLYTLKNINLNKGDLIQEMKCKFPTYNEFKKFIK